MPLVMSLSCLHCKTLIIGKHRTYLLYCCPVQRGKTKILSSTEHFPLVGHFECLDSQQNKSERFAALMSLPAWTGRSLQDSRRIGNAIRSHHRSGNTCSHGLQIRKEVVITSTRSFSCSRRSREEAGQADCDTMAPTVRQQSQGWRRRHSGSTSPENRHIPSGGSPRSQ